jgi:hypothetical protein
MAPYFGRCCGPIVPALRVDFLAASASIPTLSGMGQPSFGRPSGQPQPLGLLFSRLNSKLDFHLKLPDVCRTISRPKRPLAW